MNGGGRGAPKPKSHNNSLFILLLVCFSILGGAGMALIVKAIQLASSVIGISP